MRLLHKSLGDLQSDWRPSKSMRLVQTHTNACVTTQMHELYLMVLPVMITPSAGTMSPVSNSMTSPTRRSKMLISFTPPSLSTVTCMYMLLTLNGICTYCDMHDASTRIDFQVTYTCCSTCNGFKRQHSIAHIVPQAWNVVIVQFLMIYHLCVYNI